jgi:hypothetical protein
VSLRFDNRFLRELPGDPNTANTRRQVTGACWSPVQPTPVAAPTLLAHAAEVAALVGFDATAHTSPRFAEVFGGNALLAGMEPYAACYGGHQFGNWAGQLGDGRAITLGEAINAHGERWELQLKGAGPTPYSRTADGRAVLRSSIREFLCSEAMHHLGVPTTRALSVVTTGDQVLRDMFYNGNAAYEPGAVVCRVSPSFVRFGTFQLPVSRGGEQTAMVKVLADYGACEAAMMAAGLLVCAAWRARGCLRVSHACRVSACPRALCGDVPCCDAPHCHWAPHLRAVIKHHYPELAKREWQAGNSQRMQWWRAPRHARHVCVCVCVRVCACACVWRPRDTVCVCHVCAPTWPCSPGAAALCEPAAGGGAAHGAHGRDVAVARLCARCGAGGCSRVRMRMRMCMCMPGVLPAPAVAAPAARHRQCACCGCCVPPLRALGAHAQACSTQTTCPSWA